MKRELFFDMYGDELLDASHDALLIIKTPHARAEDITGFFLDALVFPDDNSEQHSSDGGGTTNGPIELD
jgi:hypothetical protein